MHTTLTVVALLCLVGLAFSGPSQKVQSFPGRSGDIVIQTNDVAGNSALLLHGAPFDSAKLSSIEDVRVADLFAHVMGTQPFNVHANRDGFPKGELFNKARAAFLVSLDSVAPEEFVAYTSNFKEVSVTSQSFPTNTYTMASNAATGVSPSVHGIVGETWMMPNYQQANAAGASLSANLADILSQEWQGKSLLVSASATKSQASLFAVNEQIMKANVYGIHMINGAFESIYPSSAAGLFGLSEHKVQKIIESSAFATFFDVTSNGNTIAVTIDNQRVVFDTDKEVDFSLLAELAYVYNFLNTLEKDSEVAALVADASPDFYAFAFSTLKGVKQTYGQTALAYKAALSLVGKAVQQIAAKMDQLYQGRAAIAVLALNSRSEASFAVKQAVLSSAKGLLRSEKDFETYFPALYVDSSKYACAKLRSELESPSVTVHCLTTEYEFDQNYNLGNETPVVPLAPLNVPAFWILFFIPIIMVAFILGGLCLLCAAGVDAGKDSLLFRSTGRHHHQN